ncbi:MAG TPA: hypothetical protein VFU60_15460 [Ktedonobacterales bacterium]|nr:hypothetical protein [Ktedonobacterales bacterium]
MAMHPSQFPEPRYADPHPTMADRVRHEEAASCLTHLAELATLPPRDVVRVGGTAAVQDTGLLHWSTWFFGDADGYIVGMSLLPEAEREQAVLRAMQAFSAQRHREQWRGEALSQAATETLRALLATGAVVGKIRTPLTAEHPPRALASEAGNTLGG